jgi:putative cell wall-binding protein
MFGHRVTRRLPARRGATLALIVAVLIALVVPTSVQAAPQYLSCPTWPCPEYTISGVVYGQYGDALVPLRNVAVFAESVKGRGAGGGGLGTGVTDENGAFTLIQAVPGNYILRFTDRGHPATRSLTFGTLWWGGATSDSSAQVVTVHNTNVTLGSMILPLSGSISGTVGYAESPGNSIPYAAMIDPTTGALVHGFGNAQVNSDGTYTITGLTPGDYVVRFGPRYPSQAIGSHFWPDADLIADAEVVTVTSGADTALGSQSITSSAPTVTRITGQNRFETAVEISQLGVPDVPVGGIPVVFIVNGLSFPDALSAGPAAANMGGVVLLIHPNGIPDVVAAEIARLDPQRIIVVGGPTMVSAAVFAQLGGYAPTDRWTGSNRYETSAYIATHAFTAPVDTAYLTTGVNFPDALSVGPLAGMTGRPILLVAPGSSLGPAAAALRTLGVTKLVILGGETTVWSSLQDALDDDPRWERVQRITGTNRYLTSVEVSYEFAMADAVFIANGTSFPDALAASWLAAAVGAPVVLSPQSCVPGEALDRLDFNQPRDIYVLGGSTMLGSGVETLTRC